MTTISILIPIHNRLAVTQEGIKSLYTALDYYRQKGYKNIQYKIVVIDDGSSDGSSEWISSNHKDIHLLKGDGSLWWSGSVNKGVKYAIDTLKSDYILLWNNDIEPDLNYFIIVENIIIQENPNNIIIGSKILVKDNPHKIWSAGGYFNRFTGDLGMYTVINSTCDKIECDWLTGMGTIIPISIFKKNIWWDSKRFPQYCGDSDFTLRCQRKGIKIETYLNLVLYNDTKVTGITTNRNFKELYVGLTSLRSNYNMYRNILFYTRNGYFPFSYYGMIKRYYYYIRSHIKRFVLNAFGIYN